LTAQSVAVLAVHAKAQAAWLEQKKVTANSFHRQQRIEQVPAASDGRTRGKYGQNTVATLFQKPLAERICFGLRASTK